MKFNSTEEFIIQFIVKNLDSKFLKKLIQVKSSANKEINLQLQFSNQEWNDFQKGVQQIIIPNQVINLLEEIKEELKIEISIDLNELVKISAYTNGRTKVSVADVLVVDSFTFKRIIEIVTEFINLKIKRLGKEYNKLEQRFNQIKNREVNNKKSKLIKHKRNGKGEYIYCYGGYNEYEIKTHPRKYKFHPNNPYYKAVYEEIVVKDNILADKLEKINLEVEDNLLEINNLKEEIINDLTNHLWLEKSIYDLWKEKVNFSDLSEIKNKFKKLQNQVRNVNK